MKKKMKINDLIQKEMEYMKNVSEGLSISDMVKLKKISDITSIYFDSLAEYSNNHTVEELDEYKKKLDNEDIFLAI